MEEWLAQWILANLNRSQVVYFRPFTNRTPGGLQEFAQASMDRRTGKRGGPSGKWVEASSVRLHRPTLTWATQHAIVRRVLSAVYREFGVQSLMSERLSLADIGIDVSCIGPVSSCLDPVLPCEARAKLISFGAGRNMH